MAVYEIGYVIRKLRMERGLSQEKLSEGICSPQTLSRVESGTTNLTYSNLTAIMQKLGISINEYFDYSMAAQEYEIYNKRKKLNLLLDNEKYEEAKILLDELSVDTQFQKGIHLQFYLSSFACYKINTVIGELTIEQFNKTFNGIALFNF